MLQLGLPHINVLSKIDLITQYGDLGELYSRFGGISVDASCLDFNLDFYTEVQDLSYLENILNAQTPQYASLNMAICSLIEDYALVGFETLAVEVRLE
jgi:GPN-loop GTPase